MDKQTIKEITDQIVKDSVNRHNRSEVEYGVEQILEEVLDKEEKKEDILDCGLLIE